MEILLILFTALFLYIVEGEFYRRVWSKNLEAAVKFSQNHAFCGDRGTLDIELVNRKLLPLPWLWVKLHIHASLKFDGAEDNKNEYMYYNALFCIMGWQKITRRLPFECTRRGYFPLKAFDVVGTSVLFNGKHSKSFDGCALTVYPMLANISQLWEILEKTEGMAESSGFINPDPFEFAGVREYMPYDSLKDINFKASAHTGTLMSNKHNPTVKGEITIILCMKLLKQNFEEERFEYSISLAAALAEHYISRGFTVALYSNGIDGFDKSIVKIEAGSGEGTLIDIYEALARVDYAASEPPDVLTPEGENDALCVFISPTVDFPIIELFKSVKESYSYIKWLFPVMEFDVRFAEPPAEEAEIVPVPAGFLQSYKNNGSD